MVLQSRIDHEAGCALGLVMTALLSGAVCSWSLWFSLKLFTFSRESKMQHFARLKTTHLELSCTSLHRLISRWAAKNKMATAQMLNSSLTYKSRMKPLLIMKHKHSHLFNVFFFFLWTRTDCMRRHSRSHLTPGQSAQLSTVYLRDLSCSAARAYWHRLILTGSASCELYDHTVTLRWRQKTTKNPVSCYTFTYSTHTDALSNSCLYPVRRPASNL